MDIRHIGHDNIRLAYQAGLSFCGTHLDYRGTRIKFYNFTIATMGYLQCFDTVGWIAGRPSSL